MGVLTKAQILQVSDIRKKLVNVPEWNGEVWVHGLSGSEKDAYEQSLMSGTGSKKQVSLLDSRAKFAAECIRDEKGNKLFDVGDISSLSRKSAAALDRIVAAGEKLSGMGKGDIEEMVKNSVAARSGDSISG